MAKRQLDKRYLRSRTWIVQAFNELFFRGAYTDLRTDSIIKRAGVSRSTFYEHFRNKDEVLLRSISWVLTPLADAVSDAGNPHRIRGVVDHILDQQATAQPLLAGSAGAAIAAELARLIEARLAGRAAANCPTPIVPVRLVSRQIAEAQIALLCGWLNDTSSCSSTALATAIYQSSRGLVASLDCDSCNWE